VCMRRARRCRGDVGGSKRCSDSSSIAGGCAAVVMGLLAMFRFGGLGLVVAGHAKWQSLKG
jgi:hypothetical protein